MDSYKNICWSFIFLENFYKGDATRISVFLVCFSDKNACPHWSGNYYNSDNSQRISAKSLEKQKSCKSQICLFPELQKGSIPSRIFSLGQRMWAGVSCMKGTSGSGCCGWATTRTDTSQGAVLSSAARLCLEFALFLGLRGCGIHPGAFSPMETGVCGL